MDDGVAFCLFIPLIFLLFLTWAYYSTVSLGCEPGYDNCFLALILSIFYLHRLSILGGLVVLYAGAIIPRIYFHKKRKYVPRFKILNYSRLQVYRGALITVTQTKISRNSQVLNPQESWI